MPLEPSDVESELPFDADAFGWTDEKFQNEIAEYTEAAADQVETWLGVPLSVQETKERLSRPSHVDGHDLPLPEMPVQDVVSVSIDTDRVYGGDVDEDDYWVEETHLELKPEADRDTWPTDRRSITVEWEYGFDEVPKRARKAIIRLVRMRLRSITADGVESETILEDNVSYESEEVVVARARQDVAGLETPSYYGGTA